MPGKVGRPPKKERVKRVPFGAHRSNLQVEDKIKGYTLRWFNDQDGRCQRAISGGYEYVNHEEVPNFGGANADLSSRVSKVVTRGNKKPITAYLMKIKSEWYKEDQIAKQAEPDRIDDALRQGQPGGNAVENQYVPKGHRQQI